MKMRNTLVIIIGLFVTFTGTSVFASGAEISATNEDGKAVVIALDSNNTPREDGDSRTYPTIKDFRDDLMCTPKTGEFA